MFSFNVMREATPKQVFEILDQRKKHVPTVLQNIISDFAFTGIKANLTKFLQENLSRLATQTERYAHERAKSALRAAENAGDDVFDFEGFDPYDRYHMWMITIAVNDKILTLPASAKHVMFSFHVFSEDDFLNPVTQYHSVFQGNRVYGIPQYKAHGKTLPEVVKLIVDALGPLSRTDQVKIKLWVSESLVTTDNPSDFSRMNSVVVIRGGKSSTIFQESYPNLHSPLNSEARKFDKQVYSRWQLNPTWEGPCK